MKLSRTAIFAWITGVLGLLSTFGVILEPGTVEGLLEGLGLTVDKLIIVYTGVILLFRKVTDSPVLAGVKGFLGLK